MRVGAFAETIDAIVLVGRWSFRDRGTISFLSHDATKALHRNISVVFLKRIKETKVNKSINFSHLKRWDQQMKN